MVTKWFAENIVYWRTKQHEFSCCRINKTHTVCTMYYLDAVYYKVETIHLTLVLLLLLSMVTASWFLWSLLVHFMHTGNWSFSQNIVRNWLCFLHTWLEVKVAGSISLCFIIPGSIRWGVRWFSQYDILQTRHDMTAIFSFPWQMSQGTSDAEGCLVRCGCRLRSGLFLRDLFI